MLRASWFGAGRHCRPGARRLTQSFYSPPASSCNVLQTHAVVPSGTHPPSVPLVPAPLNLRSGHTPFPSFLTPERDGLERCGMPAEIASPGFPGRTRNERPPEAAADLSEGVRRTHSGRLKDRVGKQSEMTKFEPPDEPWSRRPYRSRNVFFSGKMCVKFTSGEFWVCGIRRDSRRRSGGRRQRRDSARWPFGTD